MAKRYFIVMKMSKEKRNNRHLTIPYNNGNNALLLSYNIERPHSFNASSCLCFTSNENERTIERTLSDACKRYKKHIKEHLPTEREIIIVDAPTTVDSNERFYITLDIVGLMSEHLSKGMLMDIGDTIAMLLQSLTMDLNSKWIRLSRPRKGKRKIA